MTDAQAEIKQAFLSAADVIRDAAGSLSLLKTNERKCHGVPKMIEQKLSVGDLLSAHYFAREWATAVQADESVFRHLESALVLKDQYEILVIAETMARLTQAEKKVIRECLRASAHGPFFKHDGEFHTLMGFWREEAARLAKAWPEIGAFPISDIASGVNNMMLHLFSYPHGRGGVWGDYISVPEDEVVRLFQKWNDAWYSDPDAEPSNIPIR